MASKTGSKPSAKQNKAIADVKATDASDLRSLPSQASLENKLGSALSGDVSKNSIQRSSNRSTLTDVSSAKSSSLNPKESIESCTQKVKESSSKPGPKTMKEGDLALGGTRAVAEDSIDQEKKTSECGSGKDSSVSAAKVSDGTNSLAKTSGSAKISDRVELVESGKSSMCRGSTSSDISDESTCSSFSSSISKPHKANDLRWEAIQAVRARDGLLGLGHFRLLKRLGCGDIGSVYLSELSGTKCYFAMKVMDKGSLASRKKLLRAQTEREILQSLDHPFLPTLYTHFETDKFSCLVMEFCPGGDLHTLRQRQQGKHFTEQAVKYVHCSPIFLNLLVNFVDFHMHHHIIH